MLGSLKKGSEDDDDAMIVLYNFTMMRLCFSGGESRLEGTRRDFLGKLRSMTGGQVVAVTVDKVYKNKSQPEKEKLKQVSGSDH